MTKRVLAVMLLSLSALLLGCGEDEPVVRVDLSKREEVRVQPPRDVIRYAYLPQYSHSVSFARHGKLVEHLKEITGLPLLQVYPDSFEEHVKMVERGEIDISFSNPLVYIRLAQSGARAFARILEKNGKPDFRGQIISRKDNPDLTKLVDCKGKKWIAVDAYSAGGFLFALGLFNDLGIARRDFAEIAFAPGPGGKQEKVVLAVYAGKFDFGSIREGTLDVVGDKVDLDRIRVLGTTSSYPGWVFAARNGLDPQVVEKIASAMFRMNETEVGEEIFDTAGFKGIIRAADSDYNSVRELVARLGLE